MSLIQFSCGSSSGYSIIGVICVVMDPVGLADDLITSADGVKSLGDVSTAVTTAILQVM